MEIQTFITGIIGTNTYLVINEQTKEAVLIDPAACPKKLMEYIGEHQIEVKGILLTHGHFDHIMGISDFHKVYKDVPVYAGKLEEPLLNDAHWNQSDIYTKGYVFSDAVYVEDGAVIHLAGYDFKVFFTPGHTPGGVCYYVESEGILFSGDTLFCNSVGRTDFQGGSMSDLVRGIKEKLMPLPDETKVLPGHMDATLIGHERKYNPYLMK
nr:MBL fold metallo-hydrolase [uncultured Sellimonas sp.]